MKTLTPKTEQTKYVWIRVNFSDPGLYYKLKTVINLEEKRAQVIEYENE